MQIQLSSKDLSNALSAVGKVIQSKNAMPILDSVLLSERDGKFYLTGASPDNELSVAITLSVLSGTFHPVCLPIKTILPVLGSMGDQPLTITLTEAQKGSFNTEVKYLQGKFNVVSLAADEFPRLIQPEEPTIDFRVKTQYLLPALQGAAQCAASDELRPQMCSAMIDITNTDPQNNPMPERIVIVGSDGHLLYRYIIPVGTDADLQFAANALGNVLVSKNVISAINNAMQRTETIRIFSDGKQVCFQTDNALFISRAIEGRYPNYNSVIPKQHNHDIKFNVKELIQSVKRVSMFSSENQLVALKQNGMLTELRAQDIDFSLSSTETVTPTETNIPDNFQIGMKSSSLLQHLANITTPEVNLELSAPNRAIILREDNPNSTLLLLLMPMLIE